MVNEKKLHYPFVKLCAPGSLWFKTLSGKLPDKVTGGILYLTILPSYRFTILPFSRKPLNLAMQMEWLTKGIAPLQELIGFLQKKSQTNNIHKKQLIKELRNNLNVFRNAFLNNASFDVVADLLSNDAFQDAVKHNFPFRKLRSGKVTATHIRDERNKKYEGWDAERLTDKIDEKIVELRNIKKMNGGTFGGVKNNISLMISNLFFRMKLLADFILSEGR